eukprot:CAMPEP_0194484606 /NCGR_PEP_ID=MMETSP0253-20130528/5887_1 /TAXON_ID=2966 /ORGANISM="Noctiluca scintillans" /LENGTH=213 /DNA_ID=CAMNT_0039324443 /DNA_START=87 /DNA_END=728 /DNA_ORIENTATION=-
MTLSVGALRMPLDVVDSLGQSGMDSVQKVVPTPVENDLLMQVPAGIVLTGSQGGPVDDLIDEPLTVATRIVRGADRNYDNQLNMDEAMEFAESNHTFGNTLISSFGYYDVSHNGEIDIQELGSFVADMQQSNQELSGESLPPVGPLVGANTQARFTSVNRSGSSVTLTSDDSEANEMVSFDAFAMSSGRHLKSGVPCADLLSIGALSLLFAIS